MNTYKLTFEIVKSEKKPSKYLVICDEMNYEAWTNKPQDVVDGLVNEWFDLGMGDELPPSDDDSYGRKY